MKTWKIHFIKTQLVIWRHIIKKTASPTAKPPTLNRLWPLTYVSLNQSELGMFYICEINCQRKLAHGISARGQGDSSKLMFIIIVYTLSVLFEITLYYRATNDTRFLTLSCILCCDTKHHVWGNTCLNLVLLLTIFYVQNYIKNDNGSNIQKNDERRPP